MSVDYYLSRLEINTRKREARRLLMNPQAMHAAVESALPPSVRVPGNRFLWRVDRNGPHASLYAVSPGAPDFTHLVEQAGWQRAGHEGWVSRPYSGLLDRLEMEQQWVFRLAANPVRMGRTADGKRKRFGHVTAAQQLQWLLDRAEKNGFTIPLEANGFPAAEVIARSQDRFVKSGGTRITLSRAVFEGVLRVADPDALRRALTHGIGRAKAYGCGLMTLAPLAMREV